MRRPEWPESTPGLVSPAATRTAGAQRFRWIGRSDAKPRRPEPTLGSVPPETLRHGGSAALPVDQQVRCEAQVVLDLYDGLPDAPAEGATGAQRFQLISRIDTPSIRQPMTGVMLMGRTGTPNQP